MTNPTSPTTREYEPIRDAQWLASLIEQVAAESGGLITLTDQEIDAAMLGLSYVNPTYGIGCNVGIFDPGIVVQVYGYRAGDGPLEGTDLGEVDDLEEVDPPKDAPDLAYVEHLIRMLEEANAMGHEAGFCTGTLECNWCETHAKDNCDGADTCRNCREEEVSA